MIELVTDKCVDEVSTVKPALFSSSEDKGALAKLVEAIKTNYNDRYEEVSVGTDLKNISMSTVTHCSKNKIHGFNCFFLSSPRSVVTGEAISWVPNPQLASTSWRRQRPRNWQPSLVKLFGIKMYVLTEHALSFFQRCSFYFLYCRITVNSFMSLWCWIKVVFQKMCNDHTLMWLVDPEMEAFQNWKPSNSKGRLDRHFKAVTDLTYPKSGTSHGSISWTWN